MPAHTEIVKCPVCQIEKQVGLVSHHIYRSHTHEGRFDADLIKQITNSPVVGPFHPEVSIGGRTFTLCPAWIKEAKGFRHESKNKKSLQNQHADCTLCYKNWLPQSNVIQPDTLVLVPAKPDLNLEALLQENQQLKAELTRFREWMRSAPVSPDAAVPNAVVANAVVANAVVANAVVANAVVANAVVPNAASSNVVVTAPVKLHRTTVKASKKETEKGMWCTRCTSCNTTAQFATDLKPCATCKKLCHFNDDLNSCYHWDCEVCAKKICKECNKSNGGNKMHPLCSPDCAKIYKAKRA
uniref:Uncharacterized protein n=1 Tax=viral metagenome TaxID=1070528 RepID=A0A6C0DSP5_9ZZZZ